jgi:hypothetical protein
MSGNLEWIVAEIGEMKKQIKEGKTEGMAAITMLLSSIESGIADLLEKDDGVAEALKSMPAPTVTLPELRPVFNAPEFPTLPPLTLSSESIAAQTAALVSALRGVAVNVEAVMPQGQAPTAVFNAPRVTKWEIEIPGQYGAPAKKMTMTPTYKES